ncbi:hypothetical protein GCM10010415_22340 [Streptomyces atrovirens]
MTEPTTVRRVPGTFRPLRVLDAYCCIGGAAYGKGGGKATTEEIRTAKGIDWSTDHFRLREALPPAYTEWIGRAYLATLAPALEVAA